VDDLLWDGAKVVGVRAGGEEIRSRVVIAADGVNSRLVESAKVRGKFSPSAVALGVKSVVGLRSEVIQERFNVHGDEGVAYTFLGCTGGMQGGGFLYTNRESVSVGVVAGIHSLIKTDAKSTELLDDLITHPAVSGLIEGATPLEYSAQLIPEGGFAAVPQLHRDGFLVVGDAAGFASNSGLLLRGMDFAVASGAMAAEVVKKAKDKGEYTESTLSQYEALLKETFVLQDLRTYRNAPHYLSTQRLYSTYPDLVCDLLERLYTVDGAPRQNLYGVVRREMKGKVSWVSLVEDLLGARAL